jgi:S1-C subfamily serine protease
MKRCRLPFLLLIAAPFITPQTHAETEQIDLKALAKKARPAVMLLVVSDADGKEIATGTGFLVSSDGKLITNHHVIENAASAVAKAENGGLFPVEGVLADDPKNDLVLLKLKGKDLPFLTLSTNAAVEVGTRVAVIGSPLGLEGTLSEGIVSGERELMGDRKKLQITAAISPGSSGSPVMNAKGDVVGIAAALVEGGQALNFAVPAEYGVRLMAKVKPSSVSQPLSASITAGGEDAIQVGIRRQGRLRHHQDICWGGAQERLEIHFGHLAVARSISAPFTDRQRTGGLSGERFSFMLRVR